VKRGSGTGRIGLEILGPQRRHQASSAPLVYDSHRQKVVLINQSRYSPVEIWEWDANGWAQAKSPSTLPDVILAGGGLRRRAKTHRTLGRNAAFWRRQSGDLGVGWAALA
jgi:hypothetical protein